MNHFICEQNVQIRKSAEAITRDGARRVEGGKDG
jgi:hypothetical protein